MFEAKSPKDKKLLRIPSKRLYFNYFSYAHSNSLDNFYVLEKIQMIACCKKLNIYLLKYRFLSPSNVTTYQKQCHTLILINTSKPVSF